MTLQLNPDTTDDYESKTLAEMRSMVFAGLGFTDPLVGSQRTLVMIRLSILNRLGLAAALLVGGDSFSTVLTNVYNACGFAALGTHPPGVDTLLTDFINQAQQMLFRRIELDKGPATLPTAGVISIDSSLVQSAAIALAKAHFGQPDAQAYGQQAEKYLSDLTQRTPPNITGQVNAAIVDAWNTVIRRYEFGFSTLSTSFGLAISTSGVYSSTASDGDRTLIDDKPVELLALANLKTKIGQPDAKVIGEQFEQYMSDVFRRQPSNATSIITNQLKITQQTLYRKYDLFRMERWWTWSLIAGQRFYGTFGDDNANSIAPTGGVATIGAAVTAHDMTVPHQDQMAVLLTNGNVLVVGGSSSAAEQTAAADLYDPAIGQFSPTGPMAFKRTLATANLMSNQQVLVCGGLNGNSVFASCEIYNPSSGTFSATASLTTKRFGHTATVLQDGTILVVGGGTSLQVSPAITLTSTCELYSPSTGVFTSVGNLATARENHTATLLPDGRVLIAGGVDGTLTAIGSTEIYDPVAKTFSAGPAMVKKRFSHTATLLADGTVLLAGGEDESFAHLNTAETFISNGTFSATANTMSQTRAFGFAALLQSGSVLVGGGAFPAGAADIYDPNTRLFTPTTGTLPDPVASAPAVTLDSGDVLIPGGANTNTLATYSTAMLFSPTSQLFPHTGSLTAGTAYYQLTAETANGQSLPGTEFFVSGVPANTAVNISWTPSPNQPFVLYFDLYGRVTGGSKQFIARIPRSQSTYIDEGTIPPNGALPIINNTQGPGSIDPRHVTWVGLSFNDNVWNPLIKGIPPMAFGQNINGVPTNYEIRQALEIWPAPTTTDWKLQMKGYFEPQVFESDDDETTLDWQAIYLQTLADAMPRFRNHAGQPLFNQLEIAQASTNAMQYIKRLVAGTHMTARYVPGVILERNAVRPVLVGPYVGYP